MTTRTVLLASLLALLLSGCATPIPTEDNQAINAAEEAIATAAARDDVRQYAPVELQKAGDNLEQANAAFAQGNRAAGEHYAYLAQRQAQLSEAVASETAARAEATRINKAREELRLQVRNQELQQRSQALESQQAEIEQLREQLSELQPKETERGIVLTISNVLFGFDSAELTSAAQAPLDRLANYLQENPDQQVRVEGFTDSVGSEEYNQELSERRADSVAAAMVERGVDSSRMEVTGYGEARPVASNDTETGRQQNRRVEFVLLN